MAYERFLSLNSMDKIMRKAGAQRVSDEAKEALANVLQKKGIEIAVEAKRMAEHAGRKTITKKDIDVIQ